MCQYVVGCSPDAPQTRVTVFPACTVGGISVGISTSRFDHCCDDFSLSIDLRIDSGIERTQRYLYGKGVVE